MNGNVRAVSLDSQLGVLGNVECRRLLVALLNANLDEQPVDVRQIEHDGRDPMLSMHHVHLPKLEALGFVESDRERHHVNRGPRFEEIRPLLELFDANRDQLPNDWL